MKQLTPLAISNFLTVASMMAFTVIVGPLIRQLELEEWHGGLMVAVAGISWLFLARPWGHASDLKGRKPVLLLAIGGFAIMYLCLAVILELSEQALFSAWMLVLLLTLIRSLIGSFYAGIPVIINAFIADNFGSDKRTSAMALIGFSNALGMIFGPFMAGLLVVYSLTTPIYLATILPLLALLVVWWKLPNEKVENDASLPKPKWHDQRLRLPMASGFVAMSSVIAAQTLVGFFAIDRLQLDLNEAAQVAGYALTAVGITLVLVQGFIIKKSTMQPIQMVIVGAFISAIGFFCLVWVSQIWQLIAGFSVIAIGLGLLFPGKQAMTANAVEAYEQGAASGTVSATYGLAMIVAPIMATLLYQLSSDFAFSVFAVMLLALSAMAIRKYKHQQIEFEGAL
ncbi:MFS transporter [Thiomicrorhabdus indica]|uniref:MFS transporter n=1 Tax=Thiomicrorhabdus indica TaxID=2267253 RepID=UPI0013EE618D|nr:MFS transporter [Thiomicrorhabdus indica]